jgi:alpha-N-arabinofuranosidase
MRVSTSNVTSPASYSKKKDHLIGFQNDGYWGMDVKQQTYTGSFWVKGGYSGTFTASLRSNLTEGVFGSIEIPSKAVQGEWVEHEFELVPEKDAPSTNNTFGIMFDSKVSFSASKLFH